ncbi:LemA family protein [Hydrogenophaga sp. PBL-H3]|uniref:LemA family protein n=1 Tax=Hydrogenophaga sp. PBL-H3 TaxID=434010 RepID=UPI00131F8007|nr:LemA family protein [Hydrogenophaga sp. PBL-H3]QHE74981.1 LemA family protein [Hydrogenophaga sp. PBL-H3]QHE79408.1 LemA family protein [Hydrogenophaga sp. PBL-H3]
MSVSLGVLLGLGLAVFFWGVGAYNRLVRLKNGIANAFGQIDVQLKRRYDLIPNLVEVARKYLAHESQTLEAVIAARNQARTVEQAAASSPLNAGALGALAGAEQLLGGALGRLFAVAEAYPDLKADQTMRDLSEELASTENRIGFARQAYNDNVLEFNDAAAQFPALIVARLFGFLPQAMLESTASEAERQALRIEI